MSDPNEIHLIRDVLDKLIVAPGEDPLGRVDGVVLSIEPDQPLRVLCLESGPTVLARRLGRKIGGWVKRLGRRHGLRHGKPVRIKWSDVDHVGIEICVKVGSKETGALLGEHWLSRHVIQKIPGSK